MRDIRHVVIHCSASPNGKAVTVQEIDRWHQARGFHRALEFRQRLNQDLMAIGYHFVIYTSGIVGTGRHIEEIGAHVEGQNAHSVGVCMVGFDKFTPAQWASLATLIGNLAATYPGADILGHRDYSPDQNGDGVIEPWEWMKTCPGFDVKDWLADGKEPKPARVFEAAS